MVDVIHVVGLAVVIQEVTALTTNNSTADGKSTPNHAEVSEGNTSKGLGTTGLIILLVVVALVFVISIVIAFLLIHRHKKKQLEIRANRASYVNHGYEQTETEHFVRTPESTPNKTAPPVKPTRRSSSKKSHTSYENVQIGMNIKDEKQLSVQSLPRNIHETVTLVVPSLNTKESSTGSSIPYIDASKDNLDKQSDRENNSLDNSNNNIEQNSTGNSQT